ncbi:TatD family hydrolase [Paraburkholderia caballeronis]|uniref:TatD DNase family protein n=1 Tax=Paraburkholderia caballeronis TaxID=416943 RepID=A0A1H7N612_9BURK|nr:TatD family hydrolase [Paraburkholderia caballeronis]PXW26277.1 TatD DNase family protein [Paraburkholderia caballeronis]PXX01824.1 TatD DNase family protein [Paraburkholderia caballeronis]RAK00981.1 TatD DNase family protein [Paraburkholderia caballeronis]TDV38191.1 TatD DNase family protein [Paraburkholderia caballeronis]SEC04767.1 TatD DNase family protein [Paraburkholderia caballeronis]
MWIDTHCHLDAAEFDADRAAVADAARRAGVARVVIPAVARENFATVRELAHRLDGGVYALGIHPLYTPQARDDDLDLLRREIEASLDDPRFVGIGEIGLDFFVPGLDAARQQHFYDAQLRLARDYDLPAICHVRKSQDPVLKGLRKYGVRRGIAHAFNGSFQQAHAYVDHGMHLGFGGNLTFERALQIRRLAQQLPLDAIVMETDAPDISPSWLYRERNTPDQVPRIGEVLAQLRGIGPDELALGTTANARAALPRLALSPA